MRFLDHPLIDRVRRNHALEHATIHVLSRRYRDLHVMGRSTPNGFILYGDLPTDAVYEAAQEALERLRAGERHLAVHPACGTQRRCRRGPGRPGGVSRALAPPPEHG